jgi:hypothetical protein
LWPAGIFVAIRKLRRVVKNQKGKASASGKSLARAREMTGENIGFADPFVAKEAVCGLGAGPVLTRPRRGRTYSMGQLLQKLSQSLAMPNIL